MKEIQKMLIRLFDYQRFDNNKNLNRLINEVLERYNNSNISFISDSALSFAAGGVKENDNQKEGKNKP